MITGSAGRATTKAEADTFIPAFADYVKDRFGVEIFIANQASLLYPALPFHPLK